MCNLQDEDDGKMVDLVSQEGDNFQVEKKVAKMSELVKTMIPGESKFTIILVFTKCSVFVCERRFV